MALRTIYGGDQSTACRKVTKFSNRSSYVCQFWANILRFDSSRRRCYQRSGLRILEEQQLPNAVLPSISESSGQYVASLPIPLFSVFSTSTDTFFLDDPTAGGQATNGEIFYYAELPMLMRNENIQQIKTFSKVNRKFVVNTEWGCERGKPAISVITS